MLFGFIGTTEVVVILVIALLVFGPQKLPEIGRQIGSAYREMNKMRSEVTRALEFESYAQPYDMPTYDSPGNTYSHGSYDYGDSPGDTNYENGTYQIPPPGPRLEQENVRMRSESEMSGPYTPYETVEDESVVAEASPMSEVTPTTGDKAEVGPVSVDSRTEEKTHTAAPAA